MMQCNRETEQGFVLVSTLIMLSILTVMMISSYYASLTAQKNSEIAQSSASSLYFAESGLNYMTWALRNDAEFDGFVYPTPVDTQGGTKYTFAEPDNRFGLVPNTVGDKSEWGASMGNPNGDQVVVGDAHTVNGQLMYFDNSPLADRPVAWPRAMIAPPTLNRINVGLQRYIMFEMNPDGTITVSMPPYNPSLPHHGSVVGVDVPRNGAIVWLTSGNDSQDFELEPFDLYAAPIQDINGNVDPNNWYANNSFPCDPNTFVSSYVACGRSELAPAGATLPLALTPYQWLGTISYGMVGYSIGYVNGVPRKVIRRVVML